MIKSTVQKGNSYEEFVAEVYQAILDKQARNGEIKPIKLERLKKLKCKSGADTKVDIYWEYKIADILNKTVIECKNYKKTVGVDDVREFGNKIQDIGDVRGVFVSKNGYQDGAKKVAKHFCIELLNIRELVEDDWEGRIRELNVQMHICSPARITKVTPKCNKEWGEQQGYKNGQPIQLSGNNNEVYIEDKRTGYKISFYDLAASFDCTNAGEYSWSKDFNDGWIVTPTQECKIDSIYVEYLVPEVHVEKILINLGNNTKAMVENIAKETKQVVFSDGTKKEWQNYKDINDYFELNKSE
jgi:hypothetical protein